MRAKLHCLRVTACDLDYHGSITIDSDFCERAGIMPLEFVEIWNKNSGARISTYVIYGEAGSKCCILNGAAARTCQAGDEVIICASEYIGAPEDLPGRKPVVLCFDANNAITETVCYRVGQDEAGKFEFRIENID